MKKIYSKCLLYVYPIFDNLMEQIDGLVEKKALSSMDVFTPCEKQCESILALTAQKDILIEIRLKTEKLLNKLSEEETDYLDYRYFKKKPKEYYSDFDSVSRSYFRKQDKLLFKVALLFEKVGIDDFWFEKNCLEIDFFKELLKRIKKQEQSCDRKSCSQYYLKRLNLKKERNEISQTKSA